MRALLAGEAVSMWADDDDDDDDDDNDSRARRSGGKASANSGQPSSSGGGAHDEEEDDEDYSKCAILPTLRLTFTDAYLDTMELKHLLWNGAELTCMAGRPGGGGATKAFVWAPQDLSQLRWRPLGTPAKGGDADLITSKRGQLEASQLRDTAASGATVRISGLVTPMVSPPRAHAPTDARVQAKASAPLLRLTCPNDAEARRWAAAVALLRNMQRVGAAPPDARSSQPAQASGELLRSHGDWKEYWSRTESSSYFYNERDDSTTWTRPECLRSSE